MIEVWVSACWSGEGSGFCVWWEIQLWGKYRHCVQCRKPSQMQLGLKGLMSRQSLCVKPLSSCTVALTHPVSGLLLLLLLLLPADTPRPAQPSSGASRARQRPRRRPSRRRQQCSSRRCWRPGRRRRGSSSSTGNL